MSFNYCCKAIIRNQELIYRKVEERDTENVILKLWMILMRRIEFGQTCGIMGYMVIFWRMTSADPCRSKAPDLAIVEANQVAQNKKFAGKPSGICLLSEMYDRPQGGAFLGILNCSKVASTRRNKPMVV